jgi:transposase
MQISYWKYNRWRLLQQADSGGDALNATQKYELIRPILKGEKKPKQISKETGIPLSNIYRYLKRFRQSNEDMESLVDKSHTNHSHPRWLTQEDKDKVVQYKHNHPHLSSRQISAALAQEEILHIHDRTVANILRERGLTTPFFSTSHTK